MSAISLLVDAEHRFECLRAQAEAHGLASRIDALARAREADGMEPADAWLDAAESTGLIEAWSSRLIDAAEPLLALGIEKIQLAPARSAMPRLRKNPPSALFTHDAAPLDALVPALTALVERLAADPDREASMLITGLGGTGGCAAGECLPEDAPPGPLFTNGSR